MTSQPHMAVTCVTCGSRLKVVDQRLIGAIANCPKCGAMVEISQSALHRHEGTPPPRDIPAQRLPQPPRVRSQLAIGQETGIDSEALTQSAVASPHDLDALVEGGSADDVSDHQNLAQTGDGLLGPVPLPADPSPVWQSESSRRVSQLGLVVTLGLFGLIAATVAFAQFARSWSRSAEQASTVRASEHQPAGENAQTVDSVAVPSVADQPDGSSSHGAAQAQPPLPDRATTPPTPADDSRARASADDAPPLVDDLAALRISRQDAAGQNAAETEASEPSNAAAITKPPPADMAELPDLPQPDVLPKQPETAELPPGIDNLPPGLRKFVPLLDLSTADNGPPQIFETPPTIDSMQLDAAAGDEIDEDSTVKRPAIDISRALTMRFAIDHGGVTLAELMLLVSQLTGVAVEVELISLDLAGISTTDSLKTPPGWMSVQQWLDQSLAAAGMAAEIIDQRVLVHATPQKMMQASGAALRLDDFGDSAAEVAQWIRPIVGPVGVLPAAEGDAEDRWNFVAQEQRIDLPVDRSALVRTLLAVESARMIRGLPGRLPRWQTTRWLGPWSAEAAGHRQGTQAAEGEDLPNRSFTFTGDAISDWPVVVEGSTGSPLDSPRTAAGLLRQLAAENQVAVIVAWHDAMRHQFYPADLAMPFTDNLPAGALLDELIGESGLQARDAGNGVWWIGSEANYDRYEVISWLTIPAGGGEATAGQLAEALGVEDPAMLPVAWDETTVLVRAPRFIARQLARFVKP